MIVLWDSIVTIRFLKEVHFKWFFWENRSTIHPKLIRTSGRKGNPLTKRSTCDPINHCVPPTSAMVFRRDLRPARDSYLCWLDQDLHAVVVRMRLGVSAGCSKASPATGSRRARDRRARVAVAPPRLHRRVTNRVSMKAAVRFGLPPSRLLKGKCGWSKTVARHKYFFFFLF